MQDRVSLYPGRVKMTPVSGQTDVYDMVRADEPTQEGTALNKKNLLRDATAALFGLGADAVPDDVFGAINSKYDVLFRHYWRRRMESNGYAVEIAEEAVQDLVFSPYNISVQYMYFDSYTVNSDGYFVPVSPTYVSFSYNSPDNADKLIGRYFCDSTELDYVSVIYKVPSTATVEKDYTTIDGTNYFALYLTAAAKYTTQYYEASGEWQLVSASDPGAYPNGTVDGVNYQYLGVPFENAREGARIGSGTYVGTGQAGSGTPCKLTFSFTPKVVFVFSSNYASSGYQGYCVFVNPGPIAWYLSLYSSTVGRNAQVVTWDENTVTWYYDTTSTSAGYYQLNGSGRTYYYVAIG